MNIFYYSMFGFYFRLFEMRTTWTYL